MPKRISDETKRLIEGLYAQNLLVTEVARQANVPYSTAYGYTRARQRDNPETGQPFKSLTELQYYRARQRDNPETGQPFKSRTELQYYRARQRDNPETGQPFKSLTELRDYRARQRDNPETGQPFKSRTEYEDYQARQRDNPETGQPFKSRTELQDYQARQRKQKPINQELSYLVQQRLTKLGQTQKWLAVQLGITTGAVSRYISGKTTPRKSLQEALFKILELPYKTLDDLLE